MKEYIVTVMARDRVGELITGRPLTSLSNWGKVRDP